MTEAQLEQVQDELPRTATESSKNHHGTAGCEITTLTKGLQDLTVGRPGCA